MKRTLLSLAIGVAFLGMGVAHATPTLIATGQLDDTADRSGLTGTLESGVNANLLGGCGSALAWAGGNTFIAMPDRGPNATDYAGGAAVDNTTSYIPRINTITLKLKTNTAGAALPYRLIAKLQSTTLFYSTTPLNYGITTSLPNNFADGTVVNRNMPAGRYYFSGRSDNFGAGTSTDPANARFDSEGMRVANDGKSVFVSDEYGPYVRQFDRASGALIKTFALPDNLAVAKVGPIAKTETKENTSGRVSNKGMEGLAITPDGKMLVGFMQGALIQDGGDKARYNRIITIDIATGATHEYAYDNQIDGKHYNSSEILALNTHEFLVLERDGKGLGEGNAALLKRLMKIDLADASDVTDISGETQLAPLAVVPTEFLDIVAALNAGGIASDTIPGKLEGLAFGEDITIKGVKHHTLWMANDNDFVADKAGPNRFFVFAFTDADLGGSAFVNQSIVKFGSGKH
ncbi:MAG TPA: esterase-like activity of phytase family protein [Rhodocyclaceae bacterium]|nr:esterase-like activity of phytase family protein [Rhodocyclaceae bacterium]